MWAHYERERANGRTPTGAELDRIAGTNNYGRKVLRRWNKNGVIGPRVKGTPLSPPKAGARAARW